MNAGEKKWQFLPRTSQFAMSFLHEAVLANQERPELLWGSSDSDKFLSPNVRDLNDAGQRTVNHTDEWIVKRSRIKTRYWAKNEPVRLDVRERLVESKNNISQSPAGLC